MKIGEVKGPVEPFACDLKPCNCNRDTRNAIRYLAMILCYLILGDDSIYGDNKNTVIDLLKNIMFTGEYHED